MFNRYILNEKSMRTGNNYTLVLSKFFKRIYKLVKLFVGLI